MGSNPPHGVISILGKTIESTEIINNTIIDDDLASGTFPKITGIGAQTQDFDLSGNKLNL